MLVLNDVFQIFVIFLFDLINEFSVLFLSFSWWPQTFEIPPMSGIRGRVSCLPCHRRSFHLDKKALSRWSIRKWSSQVEIDDETICLIECLRDVFRRLIQFVFTSFHFTLWSSWFFHSNYQGLDVSTKKKRNLTSRGVTNPRSFPTESFIMF